MSDSLSTKVVELLLNETVKNDDAKYTVDLTFEFSKF